MSRFLPPLALLLLLGACTSGPPTTVHLTLRAASGLNPDETGLPDPVQATFFMLREATTFDNTDYFQLAGKESAVLGTEMLSKKSEMVHPGQTRELTLPVPPGTKMIAVSAAFRNIDQGTWRATTPLAGKVTVDFGAQTVRLSPPQ